MTIKSNVYKIDTMTQRVSIPDSHLLRVANVRGSALQTTKVILPLLALLHDRRASTDKSTFSYV